MGVHTLDDARVEADAGGEEEMSLADPAEVDGARVPVAGQLQQVLGCVDHVGWDPEHPAVDVRASAGKAGERRAAVDQPVGRLVDGAVAAERDDRVVALCGCLAAELGRVITAFGIDRVDDVAAAQGGDDELLEPAGDGRRVRIDDHQQPSTRWLGLGAQLGDHVDRWREARGAHETESLRPG